ncbi:hypothetical protein C463_02676 [Halorubrum californiense DSM 19288]|uniref:Uncharacterized protein n=1 Tax=Halorubrum californiense DSM 19288 TaxID=1227465 RepID=M0EK27_9EURY|nr:MULTISPECIES: hypothetical protein [Halorubrum]ELZ47428.1 hypothetical protein C463_02676 [Halorubrum californiense DSM 19288]TKX72211.1 hypothetical protein EXE40_05065 [Halorubrum sp. GN11GM_10-3_MGM]
MEPTAPSLSRTYSDRVYPDPWEKVLDYRRVREYAADHPTAGRVRVGRALDLPAERVRGWLDDAVPDPVRGIDTAADRGWLDPGPEGEAAAALVELLAHVLAGGSIPAGNYVPAVTPGERVRAAEIRAAFERVGAETRTRNADAPGRAVEVVPTCDGTVLGRCLVAMGAPTGPKTSLDHLPAVVWDVPRAIRRSFARTYVRHRGLNYADKSTTRVQVERPRSFIAELRDVLDDVLDEGVSTADAGLTISADAARELGVE